jgi:hypothetical protein
MITKPVFFCEFDIFFSNLHLRKDLKIGLYGYLVPILWHAAQGIVQYRANSKMRLRHHKEKFAASSHGSGSAAVIFITFLKFNLAAI